MGLWLHTAFAQSTYLPSPEPGLKYSISYTLEESNFHMAGTGTAISSLSPLDIEWMRPHTIIKQVVRRVTEDDHHSTSIIILNPAEAYADFPHRIGRIEINQQGIQVYGTDGNLYRNHPTDVEYQADYNSMRTLLSESTVPIMYNFPSAPNSTTIQAIQAAGGTVTMLQGNAWEFSKSGNTTKFEPQSKRITSTKYEGETLKETRIQEYVYTQQSIYALSEDVTKKPLIRPSGACMEEVTRKRYTNYSVAVIPSERDNHLKASSNKSTHLWPNPASSKLTVLLGNAVIPETELKIFDLVGKQVYHQPILQSGSEIEIPLNGWANGLYFVRLETETGLQTLKFIKQPE